MNPPLTTDFDELATQIRRWGADLGFQQLGFAATDLQADEPRLQAWLAENMHGEMDYMERHGSKRTHPEQLVPGTLKLEPALHPSEETVKPTTVVNPNIQRDFENRMTSLSFDREK